MGFPGRERKRRRNQEAREARRHREETDGATWKREVMPHDKM